jgi:uncharacterized protein
MKPAFSISSGGADITGRFNERLLDLKLTVHAGHENDELTLNLDDRDFAITAPPTGAQLGVSLGYNETGLVFMGSSSSTRSRCAARPLRCRSVLK